MSEITDPVVYKETVKEVGFIEATAEAVGQILVNKATIEEVATAVATLRTELAEVQTLLAKRLEKLEKPPK